jgi:hypothetical protein
MQQRCAGKLQELEKLSRSGISTGHEIQAGVQDFSLASSSEKRLAPNELSRLGFVGN